MGDQPGSCCSPAVREPSSPAEVVHRPPVPAVDRQRQALVPGGVFAMGDSFGEGYPGDGETPVHFVELDPFWMDRTAVTNAEFAAFAEATGYVTDAERLGVSAVFHLAVSPAAEVVHRVAAAPWWLAVRDASWHRPEGRGSTVEHRLDHPVVHVSWGDAQAYCRWRAVRLATEAEWEYAARGGLTGARYPWGDELAPGGTWRCNIWQGEFPLRNTFDDGYLTTAPGTAYEPNAFGLHDLVGNVWEWCADWFDPAWYLPSSTTSPRLDSRGPTRGENRVMRGGSYLCHASYCHRYRVAARSSNHPSATAANLGFRCVSSDPAQS